MTYKINKTDGSLLTEIIDSAVDQTATDITLIGKNVTGYGEYINENFVKILENFASTTAPSNPLTGQIWFDLSENRLKVYDGNGFRIGSGPIVSSTAPLNANQGDFWIDSVENQLYFYDGTDRVLAGPVYKDSQGLSGFEVETISDINGNPKVITKLWTNANLVGIFSSHTEFQPASNIGGYPTGTTIKPGFNPGLINNFKIYATALSAEALVDAQGNLKTVENLMVTNGNNNTTGRLIINNPNPLTLGISQETDITVSSSIFQIRSNENGQDIKLTTRVGGFWTDALTLKANTSRAGIFNNVPQAMLHVGTSSAPGSVIIEGNLTVNGATTTINSTNLSIDDKNIELARTATPTDVFADGGGVILKGDTDHGLIWERSLKPASDIVTGKKYIINTIGSTDFTVLGASSNTVGLVFIATTTVTPTVDEGTVYEHSWKTSENFEISQGHSYKINGVDVLTETTLGPTITSAPGITTFGILNQLQVDDIYVDANIISSDNRLHLAPGTGEKVYLGQPGAVSPVILRNVSDPDNELDAANKRYVDNLLTKPWTEIDDDLSPYQASRDEKLLISTISNPVTVVLPQFPFEGDTIRFIDFDSEFDTNNLTIIRYRKVDNSSIYGLSSTAGTYEELTTTTVTGVGSGLEYTVETTQSNAVYNSSNTGFTVIDHGVAYKDNDTIKIPGSLLGGNNSTDVIRADTITQIPHEIGSGSTVLTFNKSVYPNLDPSKVTWNIAGTGIVAGVSPFAPETTTITDITEETVPDPLNPLVNIQVWKVTIPRELTVFQGTYVISDGNDLIFNLYLDAILGFNEDLVINTDKAAFGLVYLNPAQGWRYTEVTDPPSLIRADIIGNVTGDVLGNVSGNLTGNVSGNLTGNVLGNVIGNLTGSVLTAAQPAITSVGTLSSLTVSGAITGNLTGTVTGSLVGNMTGTTVTGPSSLTLQSSLSSMLIKSGNGGLRISAVENTGAQEQYVIQVVPATSPSNRSSTILYGDVVVSNQTTSFTNGSSFKLPTYTTSQRDSRTMTFLNNGEMIYNEDTGKIQAYANGNWVDLH
jgi:hypothetical protein